MNDEIPLFILFFVLCSFTFSDKYVRINMNLCRILRKE